VPFAIPWECKRQFTNFTTRCVVLARWLRVLQTESENFFAYHYGKGSHGDSKYFADFTSHLADGCMTRQSQHGSGQSLLISGQIFASRSGFGPNTTRATLAKASLLLFLCAAAFATRLPPAQVEFGKATGLQVLAHHEIAGSSMQIAFAKFSW
jgi:hypothetical protein